MQVKRKMISPDYVLEISSDFLVNKLIKNKDLTIVTPFLRHISLSKNKTANSRYNNFLQSWKDNWNTVKTNLDLCHNQKYELLLSRFSETYENLPNNINAIIKTHQSLILFCNKILPKNTLHEYSKMKKNIVKLMQNNNEEMTLFFERYNLETIIDCERKILQLIKSFLDKFPKFVPMFNSLTYKENIDLRLSTLTFEDIKSFYQDAYELILFLLPQVIGLNNIYNRKKLNNFSTSEYQFNDKINLYNSKFKIYEELFNPNDKFSCLINSEIKNYIRNSIGHFNYNVNDKKQTVIFIDSHKGNENIIELSLVVIAKNCIYMFYTLINLLELNYELLKISQISQSVPNIKN